MSYERVIPRDFFNEAKLLKCLGQLALSIHEGRLHDYAVEQELTEDRGFEIELSEDGSLYCANYILTVCGEEVALYTPYNSKASYPLLFADEIGGHDTDTVFDDAGAFTPAFLTFLRSRQS